ncbi:MAG: hypothetical protein JRJ82_07540 [Deltaproteobacteria bacterium]|nr:hypothetical protein [Deltaproteobacteria bacterium]
MKIKRFTVLGVLALFVIIEMAGCSEYGRLQLVPGQGTGISIAQLEGHWQDYDIYYSVWPADQPIAILFDPRADDKRLVAESWIKMRPEEKVLSRTIKSIHSRYYPKLYEVRGPDDQLYGYVYSGRSMINVEAMGKNVLRVHDLEVPPPTDV